MDADEQGICLGRAPGDIAQLAQEPKQDQFVGAIGVHRRPSAVPKAFSPPSIGGSSKENQ
jgi:hypothetical protein